MRQRFEQQLDFRITPISEVQIPTKSRDELPPVLRALQHIFVTPELNETIFKLLEEKICKGKKKTGRKGMDLWHIFVLAVVRQTLDTNWDRLHWIANGDTYIRGIMGVLPVKDEDAFEYQTILDNVSLLDDELLLSINNIVVQAGHSLIKKKDEEVLRLKSDSYVLETNIHFPTDLNLLWDSCRKCLDTVDKLMAVIQVSGWRKIKQIRKKLKSQFRETSHQVFRGKNEENKKQSVKNYMERAQLLYSRCEAILNGPVNVFAIEDHNYVLLQLLELERYLKFAETFMDQIERRLLKGESIPAEEKIFSIFEEHTEWISKGKLNKRVELGHLLLITTDQNQYILDYKIMEGEKDAQQIDSLLKRLECKFPDKKIISHSFDKGFYSYANMELLQKSKVEQVILPKRGRHNNEDKEREGTKSFKKLRNQHSAIESNINMLEHHGLNRCVEKGMHGFKRCVGLSVLAYNLHIMGNQLVAKDKVEEEKKQSALIRKAG